MSENTSSPKMSIPVAIVVAGGLIALAVFMSNSSVSVKTNEAVQNTNEQVLFAEIPMKPIVASDGIRGNPNAPIIMVEFSDLECPFCKTIHKTMIQIMDTYGKDGKVAWVFKHFPLVDLHPKAFKEAVATECAREQGGTDVFWKYIDRIFEVTPSNNQLAETKLSEIAKELGLDVSKFNSCLESDKYNEKIEEQYQEALDAGGRGTPYTVFLLKTPLSSAQEKGIETLQKEVPPDVLSISSDKLKVVVGGAMPYGVMDKIIKALSL